MPDWNQIVRERISSLGLAPTVEADLVDELAQHLEDRYRELCAAGEDPGADPGADNDAAFRAVLAELDDMAALRAAPRVYPRMPKHEPSPPAAAMRGNFAAETWRDLKYAGRAMRKSPLFVLFVVATLGLGIGANTTVFTAVNTMLLNPLPVHEPSRLVAIAAQDAGKVSPTGPLFPVSYPDLKDYREQNQVFTSLAVYTSPRPVTLRESGASERIFAELVSDNYFSTLGITPLKGRFFSREDNVPGGNPVAVLSYGAWNMRYGRAADILGKTFTVNSVAVTIIGIGPPGFIGANALFGPDLWMPAALADRLMPGEMQYALTDRAKALFLGIGRLRPGVTRAHAQADFTTMASALAQQYPATDEGHAAVVRPVRDLLFNSASSGSSVIFFAGAGLLIVVGIVLLIACSNVANLLLARSASRRHEMAVRIAIGASRARLVRQLLTESMSLALLSGAAGLALGFWGLRLLFGTLPAAANFIQPRMDETVFAYALLLSVATGFLFGAAPALKASRAGVAEALKEDTRGSGRGKRRVTFARALMVGQVALSFLLLMTAALFLRSIARAYALDPGFQTAHLAIFMTSPGQAGYDAVRTKAFYKDAAVRVSRLPGVESVSWSSNLPLWARTVSGVEIEGRAQRSQADRIRSIVNTVAPGYFETAGVALLRGRAFTQMDRDASAPVAIVNDKMARDYWPSGAIGRRVQLPGETALRRIVGVTRNANYITWGEAPQACIYVPFDQHFSDAMTLYVRSKGDPNGLLLPIQREIHAAAPEIVIDARTGAAIVDGGMFQAKVGVGMLGIFGLLALALASIGLYGILAYSVNERKREIGLRMALGATQNSVLALVLRDGMRLVATGMVLGLAASLAAGTVLRGLLYGVGAADPLSMALASGTLLAVALLACWLPARWATRVDPNEALRQA
ncbi:MAG TPA: ABC transporter permease [Bryobacteraceae bacterium]|jgi:predicted permease|nr:ABC transporter permease [Bryobacteraceae bacterium]